MKLPAVAIVAAFAGGILLGGLQRLQWIEQPYLLGTFIGSTFLLIILGLILTKRGAVWPAAGVSAAAWAALGMLAAVVAARPSPPEHVLTRFAANQIPQRTPLRWHGILRGEPARLPWGYSLEISLTGVETAAGYVAATGGMRLGLRRARATQNCQICMQATKLLHLRKRGCPWCIEMPGRSTGGNFWRGKIFTS